MNADHQQASTVRINGTEQPWQSQSILALLQAMNLTKTRVAVERNGDIVPRSQHETTMIQAGDRIEIVHALGGG